ncbi:hypothetical protein D3C71_290280 [compost metagenome]
MSDFIKTLDDLDGGLTADIHYDQDTEMPYAGDEGVHIVVLSRKYPDPAKGALGTDAASVERWRKENDAEWYSVPLWAYDHSGIVFRVGAQNPFTVDVDWDTARAGVIALKRSEWGDGAEGDDKLFEYAQGVAETYSHWANGECFGYVLKDEDGEEIDSCWGFIGMDHVEEEARSSAKNHAPEPAPATP